MVDYGPKFSNPDIWNLPGVAISKIMFYVAYPNKSKEMVNDNMILPLNLLPFSQTCKFFRYHTSKFLTDDRWWLKSLPETEILIHCPHLLNLAQESLTSSKFEICASEPCAPIHRVIAFYKLAVPSLEHFDVALAFASVRLPELLLYIIELLIYNNVQLKSISFLEDSSIIVYGSQTHHAFEQLMPIIRQSAKTLKSIKIPFLRESRQLIDVLCSYPLSYIETLEICLHVPSEYCLTVGSRLLNHCVRSGSMITTLILINSGVESRIVPGLVENCPDLETLHLRQNPSDGIRALNLSQVETFTLKRLVIEIRKPKRCNFDDIAEYVLKVNEAYNKKFHGLGVCVGLYLIIPIGASIRCRPRTYQRIILKMIENYGEMVGRSIRVLGRTKFRESFDILIKYCHYVEMIDCVCYHSDDVQRVSSFLKLSKGLKVLTIRLKSELSSDSVEVLLNAVSSCQSNVNTVKVHTIHYDIQLVKRFVESFRYGLQSFTYRCSSIVILSEMLALLNVIRDANPRKLRLVRPPHVSYDVLYDYVNGDFVYTLDVSVMKDIIFLVKTMETDFRNFDGNNIREMLQY